MPERKRIARTKVADAINPSANIIKYLRLYLSAQTPPKRDVISSGTTIKMVASIIHIPDDVSRVMYQIIEYPTIDEPNKDTFWLIRKPVTLFFQL